MPAGCATSALTPTSRRLAAYATEAGKMSEITSTDSGVHLILRTG